VTLSIKNNFGISLKIRDAPEPKVARSNVVLYFHFALNGQTTFMREKHLPNKYSLNNYER
jgi:hypothetical protein